MMAAREAGGFVSWLALGDVSSGCWLRYRPVYYPVSFTDGGQNAVKNALSDLSGGFLLGALSPAHLLPSAAHKCLRHAPCDRLPS